MFTRRLNWTHWIACLLVAVTAVLLCFGALVTTYEAAMAVPDWPATYGHNMFLFPLADWLGGPWDLFLEHGHRLLGAVVGLLSLVLATVVWRSGQSPAVRSLAVAAVILVIAQGVLGGARVLLDDKTVAKVHACTGPLFFAVATAIAARAATSVRPLRPMWWSPSPCFSRYSRYGPAAVGSFNSIVTPLSAKTAVFTFRALCVWIAGTGNPSTSAYAFADVLMSRTMRPT